MSRNTAFARRVLASSRLNSSAVATTVTNDFSVSAWARIYGYSSQTAIIYNGSGGSNGWGIILDGTSGVCSLYGGIAVNAGVSPVPTGVWFHVFFQRWGGTGATIVNGTRVSSTHGNAPNAPGTSVQIGSSSPGSIIEVRDAAIWSAGINEQERRGLALGVRPDQIGRNAALKAYYPLQNDLLDYSGNGLHLTETGSTYRVISEDSDLTLGLDPTNVSLTDYPSIPAAYNPFVYSMALAGD